MIFFLNKYEIKYNGFKEDIYWFSFKYEFDF